MCPPIREGALDRPKKPSGRHAARLRRDGITARLSCSFNFLATREIGEYLRGADIQQWLLSFGLATNGAGTPESTGQFIRQEQEQWRLLAKELDIQPQ